MPGIGTPVVYPLINTDNLFEIVDTWSKLTGKHVFKWARDTTAIAWIASSRRASTSARAGLFDFNPGTTQLNGGPRVGPVRLGSEFFAAFLIGATDQTGRTYMPITPTNRQTQFAAFFQDTYQVTRKLTLDIGLRYEYYSPVTPR